MANSLGGVGDPGGGGGSGAGGQIVQQMQCESCDPGGSYDPVPSTSPHVRGVGGRTYQFHQGGSILPNLAVKTKLFDSYGRVIGHVAWGGRYTATQSFVGMHVVMPNKGVNIWVRYGVTQRTDTGAVIGWYAVRRPYGVWTPYMTVKGIQTWIANQPDSAALISRSRRQTKPARIQSRTIPSVETSTTSSTQTATATVRVGFCSRKCLCLCGYHHRLPLRRRRARSLRGCSNEAAAADSSSTPSAQPDNARDPQSRG